MARCEPLDRMFGSGLRESFTEGVPIEGVRYEVFLAFISFLYTAEINADEASSSSASVAVASR